MHEWALAESILSTAVEAAKKEKMKRITQIVIGLGELQQVEQDIFEFALDEMLKQTKLLKDVKIVIKSEKSNFVCNNCDNNWTFDDMKKGFDDDESEAIHFIPEVAMVHARCPKCKSPDFEITKGRGVSILSIKGEKKHLWKLE
jgi:hydrogenase nickel incorporation protein HypA/HybF